MNPSPQEIKDTCQRCGEYFIFPAANVGEIISCPHCGANTPLKKQYHAPFRFNWRIIVLVAVVVIVTVACAISITVRNMRLSPIKAEQLAELKNVCDQIRIPVAALEIKTEGCSADELNQAAQDVKTVFTANQYQLEFLSDDMENLFQLTDSCLICWNASNLNAEEGGAIYPNKPEVIAALGNIENNLTNVAQLPEAKQRGFKRDKIIPKALEEIHLQCQIILDKMQLQPR